MSKLPSLVEMLESGVHFGHQSGRWHPKMKQYIFGSRNGVHIIDVEKTSRILEKTLEYVKGVVARGGVVLFVGTKRQAAPIVEAAAKSCQMPYITNRWLGGTLTNFVQIKRVLRRLKDLKFQHETGALKKYTKFEQLEFAREIEELEHKIGGIQDLEKKPEIMFVVDTRHEKTAVDEAKVSDTTIVAMCDTNVSPVGIQYCIPANDDAVKSITLIANLIAEAASEGRVEGDKIKASAKLAAEKSAAAAVAAKASAPAPVMAPVAAVAGKK
ncbi:MAG: 30S ribosomal protein S2 [bacterium]